MVMACSASLKFCICPSTSPFISRSSPSYSSSSLSFSFPLPTVSRGSPSCSVRSSSKGDDGGDFVSNNPFHFYPWDSSDDALGEGSSGVEECLSRQNLLSALGFYHTKLVAAYPLEGGKQPCTGFIDCYLAIHWVPEDRITLFTSDGLIQIGGSLVPRQFPADKKQGKGAQKFQRFQEKDYMDPNQGLCLGALFDIAATNGLDMGRRLCFFGFCRSIEMLSDVVEDSVLEHGGEVVTAEKASEGGLQEKLTMTVAVPLLWGVPPASETLHLAVRSGGGIVEKVYWQWDFL